MKENSRRPHQRTHQRPHAQKTNNQTTPHVAKRAGTRVRHRDARAGPAVVGEPEPEVVHEEDIGDLAGVVAEYEAADGGDEGEEEGGAGAVGGCSI